MTPTAPITYSKKGRKGLKLVASLSSARLRGDGDSSKRRLPKSISSADICHPHLNHYTSFGPINEAAGASFGVGSARHAKATQAGKADNLTGRAARLGSQTPTVREETKGHDAITVAWQPDEDPELRGHGSSEFRQHDSPGQRAAILPRALPHSKTSDFDFLNPRPAPLPRSTTTTFPPIPVRVNPPVQTSTRVPYHDPEDINKKVAAMLAATEMLKSKEPHGAKMPATKSKVLSKVTGLFDRLHSKKSERGSSKNISSKPGTTRKEDSCSTQSRRGLVPATNTECQHNENSNPRAWKPQRPVEHKIPRKPVPNNGMHLQAQPPRIQTPQSALGVTTHPPLPTMEKGICNLPSLETDNDVEVFPGGSEVKEVEGCAESQNNTALALVDPFESEQNFYNLEGFLTAEPVAASTPRHRVQVTKERIADGSPLQTRSNHHGRISHPSVNDADELTDPGIRAPHYRKKLGKRPAKPVLRLQRGSTNVVLDVDNIEPKRMKKHPTPSKASLEELSRQFVALVPDPYDQDELAMGAVGLSPIAATFPRAAPRLPASKTSTLTTPEYHAFIRSNAQSSSIPQTPTDKPSISAASSAWRLPFARGAKPAREEKQLVPTGGRRIQLIQPHTGDVDELQWDDETCLGRLHRA